MSDSKRSSSNKSIESSMSFNWTVHAHVSTSGAKALLAEIVSQIEDVDRYLFSQKISQARSFLDFHIAAMTLLGSVKREVSDLVIRNINYHTSELFGWNCKMLTPLEQQPPHPFFEEFFEGAVVCAPIYHSQG